MKESTIDGKRAIMAHRQSAKVFPARRWCVRRSSAARALAHRLLARSTCTVAPPYADGRERRFREKVIWEETENPDQYIETLRPNGLTPARFGLIIGDFLQNLRSSLDYLAWEPVFSVKNNPVWTICSRFVARWND
jgi:hypothetical protein